jgi:uroporphyrinogen III methyltransferase / synthase
MKLVRRTGKVYLVGAGPGDPGLLTLKAAELLKTADCVIYDYLVHPEILQLASAQAEKLYVGKQGCGQGWKQEDINRLIVEKAQEHRLIVRLKGGDPFVFGRGGEEAEALVNAGIAWEVVPGVSAGSAVAAYAGIPVTHRGLSSSVTFVTGHERPGKAESAIAWEHLAKGADTLVFFMGVAKIQSISEQLIQNGRSAATPVAVIRWGTYNEQEVFTSDLANIAALIERERVTAPALIVVGEVVRLREKLHWFSPAMVQALAA